MAKNLEVKSIAKKKTAEEKKKGKTKSKEIEAIRKKDKITKENIFREIFVDETSGLL